MTQAFSRVANPSSMRPPWNRSLPARAISSGVGDNPSLRILYPESAFSVNAFDSDTVQPRLPEFPP